MESVRFERLAAIFRGVRQLDCPERRAAYLDLECGDDPVLRAEVQKLLDNHDAAPPGDLGNRLGDALESAALEATLPTVVPGFTVLRRIGVGGMGTVYEAEQESPRRHVALKVIRFDALSDEARARFEVEARVLARLQHPGIARIYATGMFRAPGGELPYIVMELVDGPTATDFAAMRGLDRTQRIVLLIRICGAVQYAHQRGILHRDLKPSNILVADDDQPRILDFGVSRELDGEASVTRAGDLLGTLNYMSPEQAAGGEVDIRTDVYALGVVGCQLVNRKLPIDVSDMPVLDAIRALARTPPHCPGRDDLSLVLRKALAKDPELRYATAAEFADDLQRVLERRAVLARRPSAFYHLRRFVARNRALVSTVLMAVAGLIAALIISVRAARDARELEAAARRASYAARMQAVSAFAGAHEYRSARRILQEIPEKDRAWEWHYLDAITNHDIARRRWHEGHDALDITLDRNHLHVAIATEERSELSVITVPKAYRARAARFPYHPRLVAFEKDGTLLGARGNKVWRENGRVPVIVAGDVITDLETSPEGGGAYVTPTKVVVFDEACEPAWSTPFAGAHLVAFGPDRLLLGNRLRIGVWELSTGKLVWEQDTPAGSTKGAAFSPDGTMIATTKSARLVQVHDARDGSVRASMARGVLCHKVRFSPDSKLLASSHGGGRVRVWRPGTGQFVGELAGADDQDVTCLHWIGPKRLLGVTDGGFWIRAADHQDVGPVLHGHRTKERGNKYPYVYDVSFSPKANVLASVGWDGTLRLWNPKTARALRVLGRPGSGLGSICEFTDDGRHVAVSYRNRLVLWNVVRGAAVAERQGAVNALATSPSGGTLTVASGRKIHFLSDRTLERTREPWTMDNRVTGLAYDRGWLAVGHANGSCRLLDDRRRVIWSGHEHRGLVQAIASDGEGLVATGCESGLVVLWNAEGKPLRRWTLPGARIFSLVFSHDGRRLFVGSDENVIRVMDTEEGHEVAHLIGHGSYVHGLALSRDGETLASASGDNTVRVWYSRPPRSRLKGLPPKR